MSNPKTVSEMFPSPWLKPDDLRNHTVDVAIEQVHFKTLHNTRTHQEELKVILSFEGKEKRLILNKTQANAVADVLGTEVFEHWPGHSITLRPGRTRAGDDTIKIGAPRATED